MLQAPFNQVSLRAIGDDLTTSYFDLANDGSISIRTSLLLDTATFYRVSCLLAATHLMLVIVRQEQDGSTCLPVSLPACLFICLSACFSGRLPVSLSLSLSVCVPACLPFCGVDLPVTAAYRGIAILSPTCVCTILSHTCVCTILYSYLCLYYPLHIPVVCTILCS